MSFFRNTFLKVHLKIYMTSQRTPVLPQTMKTVKGFPFPQFLCFACCLGGLEGEEIENSVFAQSKDKSSHAIKRLHDKCAKPMECHSWFFRAQLQAWAAFWESVEALEGGAQLTEVGKWGLLKGAPAVSSCLSLVPCPVQCEQLSPTAHSCCDNAPLTCMDEAASN